MIAHFVLLALQAAAGGAAAAQAEPADWTVVPASACLAVQSYSTSAGIVTIGLRLDPLGAARRVGLTVIRVGADPGDIEYRIGSADKDLDTQSAWTLPMAGGRFAFAQNLSSERFESLRASRKLVLVFGKQRFELPLGDVDAAINQMDACVDDRLKSFGIDPADRKAPTPPKPITDFGPNLPESMPTSHPKGWVQVIAKIDPSGKVKSCKAWLSSGDPAVDRAYCQALERSRWAPARDASGQAITGTTSTLFTYRWVP